MNILSKASTYILDAFLKNEKSKEFKDDLFGGFIDWVRPWFLEDDPSAQVVLTMDGAEAAKQQIIDKKLPVILQDINFKTELESWLVKLEANQIREKNILKNTEITTEEDVHIGDVNGRKDSNWNRKNIVDGVKVKSRNFHLGDKN